MNQIPKGCPEGKESVANHGSDGVVHDVIQFKNTLVEEKLGQFNTAGKKEACQIGNVEVAELPDTEG